MPRPHALARPLQRGRARLRAASPAQLAGAVLLAVVVVSVAWRVVPAFTWVDDQLASTSGLTRLQRELAPARAVDIDPRPIERAAELIPPDATFAILVGEDYPFTHDISGFTLPAWSSYRLLPRRHLTDAASADWVISYGADLAPHSVFPQETLDLGLGVTLARLR
ncbi:MAG: hypothetical protein ACRDN6_13090 [Gaiellaceae bacterium]